MSDKPEKKETARTVLLALYSKAQTSFLKNGLEDAGFSVITANDGIHAVQLASSAHPDCALVSTDLPVIDAYAFTRIIKNTDYLRDIAVVIGTPDDQENFSFWTENCKSDGQCDLATAGSGEIRKAIEASIASCTKKVTGERKSLRSSVSFIKLLTNAYDRELYGLYVTREAYRSESRRYELDSLVQAMCRTMRSILDFDAFALILKASQLVEIYLFSDSLADCEGRL